MDPPLSTTQESYIRPINKDTVHRICSGQVVLSLAVAMKELVENAIDAGASSIDIQLREYGAEALEVSDNGSGVHSDSFQALTLKNYTSKIQDYEDLANIGTLGFRGEALSSLCALADVQITTRHVSAELATRLKYDYGGNIISQENAARQQGTTVTLKNLFSTLPVRKKEFEKNLKKEFTKMCNLLYAYCLLPSGVRYSCTNTTKGVTSTVVSTQGLKTVRENIISVFSIKQLASLVEVIAVTPDEQICQEYGLDLVPAQELSFEINCLISSAIHGNGRSSTDRQFFYINNRPCEPYKVIKLVNKIYKEFNTKQYPFIYLNIIAKCLVDVNITPDKRQVFIEQEKLLLATIKASLIEAFKECPSTFKVTTNKGVKRHFSDGVIASKNIFETFNKKSKSLTSYGFNQASCEDLANSEAEADKNLKELVKIACELTKDKEDNDQTNEEFKVSIESPQKSSQRKEVSLQFNVKSTATNTSSNHHNNIVKFRSNITPESNATAEEELNRHIKKTQFKEMEIIGQFNSGFIITKLDNDLFIIDQHATDEKYNFEKLQQSTVLETQKLVTPKLLELTAAARSTLLEHEQVFNQSGFSFKKDPSETLISLTSVPISERMVFGKGDIDEMIFMLQEDSSCSQSCKPSRVKAMLASRACRKSVMIGKTLSIREMRRIVDHMGEIEQPWNCPHGRPTMRHLLNLSLLTDKIDSK
ncbi:mismatch repair endonuclease PMS2 [Euwallacea similis]|uniref:mismatch repair endonuclease PMS2 n=1 Tax=Euwallacea similis TaxID=1736056 RepID=UPI00344B0121